MHYYLKAFVLNAIISNDAVVAGMLMVILAMVFYTSSLQTGFWKKFYQFVPAILLCYFLPSLLNSFGIADGESSGLYPAVRDYFLPASIVLLTLTVDFSSIKSLGPKAVIMFLTGSVGVMLGGPFALWIYSLINPDAIAGVGGDAPWRGFTAIAGSWIGGSANQAAMKEIFGISDTMFSAMITIDVITAYFWMAFLLYGAGISKRIDRWLKADSSSIDLLVKKMEDFRAKGNRIPTVTDFMIIGGVAFGTTGLAHFVADIVAPAIATHAPQLSKFSLTSSFFWIILIATVVGLTLSFTRVREIEFAGASKFGTVFLYVLVATLGLKMNIFALLQYPQLLLIALIWLMIHILIMFIVAKMIRAPFFFVAVGSQANIGGPASAPVVAAAFNPVLAPVGVLLAVLGYGIGTWAAYICGLLMQMVAE